MQKVNLKNKHWAFDKKSLRFLENNFIVQSILLNKYQGIYPKGPCQEHVLQELFNDSLICNTKKIVKL